MVLSGRSAVGSCETPVPAPVVVFSGVRVTTNSTPRPSTPTSRPDRTRQVLGVRRSSTSLNPKCFLFGRLRLTRYLSYSKNSDILSARKSKSLRTSFNDIRDPLKMFVSRPHSLVLDPLPGGLWGPTSGTSRPGPVSTGVGLVFCLGGDRRTFLGVPFLRR